LIIKKIKLVNIRSHEDTEIELHKGINVFTGRTGSGKSSVLLAIEYGLFGSDSGIGNSDILKRGKQSGYVEIIFQEGNDEYKIIRGLKRKGRTISVDANKLAIFKNGKLLPIIGRASDLNTRILEVLNYPKGIKPKELFEITSYTKQDEVRKLIELSPEKRQEYIDKILQLSKYKTTWENMKDIISSYALEIENIKGRTENLDEIKNSKEETEKKIEEVRSKIKELNTKINELTEKYSRESKNTQELEKEYESLLNERREFDISNGTLKRLEEDNSNLEQEIQKIKDEISKIKIVNFDDLEKLKEDEIKTRGMINLNNAKILQLKKEVESVVKLGVGKCPVCKQPITREHLENVKLEFENSKKKIEEEIEKLEAKLKDLAPKIKELEEAKKQKEKYDLLNEKLKDYESRLENNKKEISKLKEKLSSMKFDSKRLKEVEAKLKDAKDKETRILSEIKSLKREHELRKEELKEKANQLIKLEDEMKKLRTEKERLSKLEDVVSLLSRLRDDIKNIREVVRRNFLEDFRQEFQKKFEEIRKYEEEYSVDVKVDYEPVAYASNGEEVSISSLSGGEKTSVALAYRLALADIAAQISDIKPSEMLILDEPTTGFDAEDVKALPEALRNIKTIPQIIIVTHEEELKNAADYKFEVSKEMGKSKIKEVE
jgi:exonuclease SbcC